MKKLLKIMLSLMLALSLSFTVTFADETEESVYVMMNVPYSEFYANINNSVAVDSVSSATSQKSASCKNVYFGTSAIEGGTEISGVVVPVKMSETTYEAIKDSVTSGDHYISSVLTETPATYTTLTYANGTYSFSAMEGTVTKTPGVSATIDSSQIWGDYVVIMDTQYQKDPSTVYGAVLTTTDGSQYALRQSENMWTPRGYYEFAIDTVKTSSVHETNLKPAHYVSITGKSVASVTFYTTTGIETYEFANSLYVAPAYEGTVSADLTNDSVTLYNLPADIKDATVTVTTGGRGATVLVNNVALDGTTVSLEAAPAEGQAYQVIITSSNYKAITLSGVTASEMVYANMNISYANFYKALGLNNNVAVDTVTSATAQKSASAANVYFGATPTIEGGTDIEGVVVPVAMTAKTYEAIKALELTENDEYYVGDLLEETPAVQVQATYNEGVVLGEVTAPTKTAVKATATISSSQIWADYVVALKDDALGQAPANVYGAYITTSDGAQYALRQSENMWTPRNVYEFAINTQKTSNVHETALKTAHFAGIEGKTITTITYITTEGLVVYTLATPLYVAPHSNAEVKAEFTDATHVAVTGVPEDAEDVVVTVSVREGRNTTYLVQTAALENGVVTLDTAATADVEYTVLVETSNYAAMSTTATYTVKEEEKEEPEKKEESEQKTDETTKKETTTVVPNTGIYTSIATLGLALLAGVVALETKKRK